MSVGESKNIFGNNRTDLANVHIRFEIKRQSGTVIQHQEQLAVNIQNSGRFNSEVLYLGIRI